jgi:hypothetical protein
METRIRRGPMSRACRRIGVALGLAALAATALSGTVMAYQANGPTPIASSGLTPGGSYTYTFDAGHPFPSDGVLRAAINSEMQLLGSPGAGRSDSVAANLPKFELDGRGPLVITLGYSGDEAQNACRKSASDTSQYLGCQSGGRIWFTNNDYWSWFHYCESYNVSGCYSIKTILLHEVGHRLGMGHYSWSANPDFGPGPQYTVMQPKSKTKGTTGYAQTFYGTCDVAALQKAYGVLSTSSKYSICLPNIKPSLTLSPSSTTITYNGSVAFSATLKVASGQAFAGNLLASRRVYLQTSSDGGQTWYSPGIVMSQQTPGVYAATVSGLHTTARWRAVFDDPGLVEALVGAVSAASTVTVRPCSGGGCPL